MKAGVLGFFLFTLIFTFLSCTSYRIPENVRYDFTSRGPITDDVFQVIITAKPGANSLTQHEQRESAFISAKWSVTDECISQMLRYYLSEKKIDETLIPAEKMVFLKKRFQALSTQAIIEQEYYMPDNSIVFIVRIYSTGIKDKILNY